LRTGFKTITAFPEGSSLATSES